MKKVGKTNEENTREWIKRIDRNNEEKNALYNEEEEGEKKL